MKAILAHERTYEKLSINRIEKQKREHVAVLNKLVNGNISFNYRNTPLQKWEGSSVQYTSIASQKYKSQYQSAIRMKPIINCNYTNLFTHNVSRSLVTPPHHYWSIHYHIRTSWHGFHISQPPVQLWLMPFPPETYNCREKSPAMEGPHMWGSLV